MTEKHKQNMAPIVAAPEIEALFVQTAGGMAYHDGKLTLHDLAPTTLFFSDRPDRVTGHISPESLWTRGTGPRQLCLQSAERGAVRFHPDGVSDVVVEITEPKRWKGQLKYTVTILDGEMPASGGPNSLFIDIIGRPLSPVSVAGVARREDRRERRRL